MTDTSKTLALLIDAATTSPRIAPTLMAEIASHGTIGVRRIYADWTVSTSKDWRECLALYAIQPVQQFADTQGRNASDGALIIDAMDLLHSQRFSGFCIVSSDSDFVRLAIRMREQGVAVHGFGERHAPSGFVAACDTFTWLDPLRQAVSPAADGLPIVRRLAARTGMDMDRTEEDVAAPNPAPVSMHLRSVPRQLDDAVLTMLEDAVWAVADADGRATLAAVGTQILKQMPAFDARHYGFAKLSDLAEACDFIEVERVGAIIQAITVRLLPIHSDAPPPKAVAASAGAS